MPVEFMPGYTPCEFTPGGGNIPVELTPVGGTTPVFVGAWVAALFFCLFFLAISVLVETKIHAEYTTYLYYITFRA